METDSLSPFEMITMAAAGAAVVAVSGVAAGAWVAAALTGRRLRSPLRGAMAATTGLPAHLADPKQAWPGAQQRQLPGPLLYWAATVVALGVAIAALVVLARLVNRPQVGTRRRRPLGVDSRAAF